MHGWACWSGWQHLGLWPCAPCGLITGQGILWWFWPKVVSPVGAKQPAAPHMWGVRTPTGADLPRLWEKNPLAVLPLSLAVRHGSWATDPAQWAMDPAQGQGAARPSPERAGFRGFSRPGSNWSLSWKPRGRFFPRPVEFFFWWFWFYKPT